MKNFVGIIIVLISAQLYGFDFDAFYGKKIEFAEARVQIEQFHPEDDAGKFKKALVLHYCNYFQFDRSLEYLTEAYKLSAKLDSLQAKECAYFLMMLSEDDGIQQKMLPVTIEYSKIKDNIDYVLQTFELRTEICCKLESIKLLDMETVYLKSIRDRVFRREFHDKDILLLMDKLNSKKMEVRKTIYKNGRID